MFGILKNAYLAGALSAGLLLGYVPLLPASTSTAISQENARKVIAEELEQDLMCKGFGEHDRVDDAGKNSWLTAAGAVIKMGDDTFYNNYTYSFKQPLMVKGMPVYSVTQSVGESGAIFTAEVQGDPLALAKAIHAKPVRENDDIFGLGNELFYLKITADTSRAEQIIIGADEQQKAAGHFYFGCSSLMDL